MRPVVAIVGRPNVGKSTLFNRLAGRRLAIVHDEPGVTRDRHYTDTHVHGRDITLIDTGGFDPGTGDPMREGIARQVNAAIAEADAIVCVLDGMGEPTDADRAAVQLLRRSNKPIVYVGNRADNQRVELEAHDLHRLGVDPLVFISALHGRNMAVFEQLLVRALPPVQPAQEADLSEVPTVALIGRPNAGKSSLLNHLSGTERTLVDDKPGTTRDSIDALITYDGSPYNVVDTAGIRRKSKVDSGVEAASVIRSIRAVDRGDVAVLLCDATGGIAEQDQRLLSLCAERGRAIIVALNKFDLLSGEARKQVWEDAQRSLHFAPWAAVLYVSAKTGHGVPELMKRVARSYKELHLRVQTSELNRFFEEVLDRHPPPTSGGRAPRIYYLTQAASAPPVFVAMCSHADNIQESYRRFVVNQLRERFGFETVPVTVRFRNRRREGTRQGG